MSEVSKNIRRKTESRRVFLKKLATVGGSVSAFTLLNTGYPKVACADPGVHHVIFTGVWGEHDSWWWDACGKCPTLCNSCDCGCACNCDCNGSVQTTSGVATGDNGGGTTLSNTAGGQTSQNSADAAWLQTHNDIYC